jgi:hypothetical protein
MMSESMPAQRSVVARPGRRLRAERRKGSMPERCSMSMAEWRRPFVMKELLM